MTLDTTAPPTNHLAGATSAYLLQHAHQPVQWYPWGEAALSRARLEDKPILLSIGYAACHWCHVMARESFDDPATAALMNDGFINIKVDREERPDLDQLYQMTHQLLRRGGGGWPLTVFLSPHGVPFYSGTYFPATAQAEQPAFRDVLGSVSLVWRDKRAALAQQDQALLAALDSRRPRADGTVLDATVRDQACQSLTSAYDAEHGGFGGAPKFPHPTDLAFLLRRGRDEGDAQALAMALTSLRKMAEGGLYDQLGGGFFRYSTDARWRIPHFEKMLYDNGVLLALYAEAWALTGEALFARVVDHTVAWVLREMTSPEGGFYASLAADDRHGREGHFYVWQPEAMRLALTPNEWDLCAAHWGLVDAPGFEGRDWHLHIARSAEALSRTLDRPVQMVTDLIESSRHKLLTERDKRDKGDHPLRDEKQLTGWIALMITGLARASAACSQPDWLTLARRALAFLRAERWQDGQLLALPGQPAFLDDHAFLLEALLAVHAVDPTPEDRAWALDVADVMVRQFEDPVQGGFFFTRHDAPPLIHRQKIGLDAATPSGNGTAALALQQLGRLTNEVRWFAAAERCVLVFASAVRDDPASHTRLLQAALSA